jgi:hypothetical protein
MRKSEDDMLDDYSTLFENSAGIRGKYFEAATGRPRPAILESDIRAAFPTDEAVNLALRQVLNQTASSREPVAKK